jgi:hypothetical protein
MEKTAFPVVTLTTAGMLAAAGLLGKKIGVNTLIKGGRKVGPVAALDSAALSFGVRSALSGKRRVSGTIRSGLLTASGWFTPEHVVSYNLGHSLGSAIRSIKPELREKRVMSLLNNLRRNKEFLDNSYAAKVVHDGLANSLKPKKDLNRLSKLLFHTGSEDAGLSLVRPMQRSLPEIFPRVTSGVRKVERVLDNTVGKVTKYPASVISAGAKKVVGGLSKRLNTRAFRNGIANRSIHPAEKFSLDMAVYPNVGDAAELSNAFGKLIRRDPLTAARLGSDAYKFLPNEARKAVRDMVLKKAKETAGSAVIPAAQLSAVATAAAVGSSMGSARRK